MYFVHAQTALELIAQQIKGNSGCCTLFMITYALFDLNAALCASVEGDFGGEIQRFKDGQGSVIMLITFFIDFSQSQDLFSVFIKLSKYRHVVLYHPHIGMFLLVQHTK